jgi:A/G-specific adenine glycosylase
VVALLNWFAANARDLPWRRTRDPYAIWVSEIMLQQTQVKTVIPFYERWLRELPSIASLAGAPSEKIHKLWEGLGYYTRVRNMQRAAQLIVAQREGKFPTSFDDVLALAGIGRYTAGAICSIAFNQPRPILDGNVIRVLTRVFGIRENARDKVTSALLWNLSEQLVTSANALRVAKGSIGNCSAVNQSLMELGALICTPRAPQCDGCPISKHCVARRDGSAETLPNLGPRAVATPRRFIALVVQRNRRTLVRQRPAEVVNGHLWEFPNIEVPLKTSASVAHTAIEAELGCDVESIAPLTTIRHSITRYRITLDVMRVELNGSLPRAECGSWKSWRDVESLPFTSAHRKIAALLRV